LAERDASLDVVRIVGIVAIVAGHTLPGSVLHDVLFIWHVPIFFFLSGYLWSRGRTMKDEASRRSKTLVKPYVFWFVVIYLPFLAGALLGGDATWEQLLAPIYGGYYAVRPFTTFWFVLALFATALVWRALERAPLPVRIGHVALAVALAPLVGGFLARTPLSLGTSLVAVVFLALGQLARHIEPRLGTWGPLVGLGGLVVVMPLVVLQFISPLGIKEGDWGTPVVSIVCAAIVSWSLVLLSRLVGSRLSARAASTVSTLAVVGLTVVLVHPAVLWVLERFHLPDVALFVAALVVPAIIGLIALRTPLSPWVTGAPRRAGSRANVSRV